jgi:aspartate carbamoyltransferase catalytic subunit
MHLAALHTPSQIQLNQQGNLKHFLTIEGLSKETLTKILDTAQSFINDQNQLITTPLLEGRTVMNLFLKILLVPVLLLKRQQNVCLPMC